MTSIQITEKFAWWMMKIPFCKSPAVFCSFFRSCSGSSPGALWGSSPQSRFSVIFLVPEHLACGSSGEKWGRWISMNHKILIEVHWLSKTVGVFFSVCCASSCPEIHQNITNKKHHLWYHRYRFRVTSAKGEAVYLLPMDRGLLCLQQVRKPSPKQ